MLYLGASKIKEKPSLKLASNVWKYLRKFQLQFVVTDRSLQEAKGKSRSLIEPPANGVLIAARTERLLGLNVKDVQGFDSLSVT